MARELAQLAEGKAAAIPDSAQTIARGAIIFDCYPLLLDVVARFLKSRGIDVLGSTTSTARALELIEELSPDIFVVGLDTETGSQDEIELVRNASTSYPELKVIALANGGGVDQVEEAFAAGVSAYVTNAASPDDILVAIKQMFETSIHLAVDRKAPRRQTRIAEEAGLTTRETEILALAAKGRSNAELAELLSVTPQTVKFHLSNVYRKLNVSNRTQASRWAQLANVAHEGDEPELRRAG